jgi:hypothetical protein
VIVLGATSGRLMETMASLGPSGWASWAVGVVASYSHFSSRRNMMKKLLALALGVLLVSLAVPAFAESTVEFKGYYRLNHFNSVNASKANTNEERDSESYFRHRINLGVTFHATDDIDFDWIVRGPHWERWGALGVGGRTDVETYAAYATITQPWGTVQIGRLADGLAGTVGGLSSLGHDVTWGSGSYLYAGGGVFDFNSTVDGINYNHEFGNGFGFAAYYFKMGIDLDEYVLPVKDNDIDRFGIEPRYTWDGGGASLGVIYQRDMETIEPYNVFNVRPVKDYLIGINPALTQSWGAFSIGFEAAIGFGETTWRYYPPNDPKSLDFKQKKSGLGLYLDANYNYGAGDVSFLAWYVSGTDEQDIANWGANLSPVLWKRKDAINLGDFSPFLIAYGYNGVGGDYIGSSPNGFVDDARVNQDGSNQWGLGLLGNHSITDDISVNYGLGYISLVKPVFIDGPNDTLVKGKKDLGIEIDLGFKFNLLENLTFETQFGYMFNGDAYKETTADRSPKDTFAWLNALQVNF